MVCGGGCEAIRREVEVEELTDNRFSHMQKDRQASWSCGKED